MEKHEPLVEEDRLSRAWEVITSRVPGRFDAAVPDAYIQPAGEFEKDGKTVKTPDTAVFAVAEPNPRHVGHLQVSVVHFPLSSWRAMEAEAKHFVSAGFDPLTWCLFQAAKGHLQAMDNIRAMSHPVVRIDEFGKERLEYPTGQGE